MRERVNWLNSLTKSLAFLALKSMKEPATGFALLIGLSAMASPLFFIGEEASTFFSVTVALGCAVYLLSLGRAHKLSDSQLRDAYNACDPFGPVLVLAGFSLFSAFVVLLFIVTVIVGNSGEAPSFFWGALLTLTYIASPWVWMSIYLEKATDGDMPTLMTRAKKAFQRKTADVQSRLEDVVNRDDSD